jgi:hypothetical protein
MELYGCETYLLSFRGKEIEGTWKQSDKEEVLRIGTAVNCITRNFIHPVINLHKFKLEQ